VGNALHASGRSKVAIALTRVPGRLRLILLLAVIPLFNSVDARGDVFKWTDERGTVNFSNVAPITSGKPLKVEVVLKEAKPASNPERKATQTEQALIARIEGLESQLRGRKDATQGSPAQASLPYGSYYPTQPAPPLPYGVDYPMESTPPLPYIDSYPPEPAPADYYGSGYSSDLSGFYPGYYYPVAASYVAYPARPLVSRRTFAAPRGRSFRGSGHRGRR